MSRKEIRKMLETLNNVLENTGRIDVFVNDVMISNYFDNSEISVDYDRDEDYYAINLVIDKIYPVCTILEHNITDLSFYVYDMSNLIF